MTASEMTRWQAVNGDADLYRWRRAARGAVATPVLMVAGRDAGLEAWGTLGEGFARDGFRHIYAHQPPADAGWEPVAHAIEAVLAKTGAPWLALVAHGDACAPALHYVEAGGGYRNVRFLVGIDGRYQSSALSYLEDDLLQRDQDAAPGAGETPSPYSPDLVNQFVMFNFYGHARTSILEEGTRSVPPLPEAINLGLNLHPNRMMEAPDAYAQLRQFFADGFWMVQLHLTSIQMRKGAPDAALGQFYFEVAGYRVPPDGVFAPSSQSTYVFEHFTPLGTVAFPANKAAADVNFRLREVGRAAEKRRTLFTTLHVPLVHGDVSDHVMQDSFGSEIRLRVHCTHVPQIIPVEYGG